MVDDPTPKQNVNTCVDDLNELADKYGEQTLKKAIIKLFSIEELTAADANRENEYPDSEESENDSEAENNSDDPEDPGHENA